MERPSIYVARITPLTMTHWTWKTWQVSTEGEALLAYAYLTCDLLPQPHGFFTQHFHPHAPADLAHILARDSQVYRVKQVHSGDVLTPSEIDQAIATGLPTLPDGRTAPFPLADGILTEQPNQAVWACSADCTPALIGDVKTGQVAAVHAGWRGTAQKILPAAIARFESRGSVLENLRVALGPAIAGEVYQVEPTVAAQVGSTVAPHLEGVDLLEHLLSLDKPPVLDDAHPERVRLDVRRVNQLQLEQLGLSSHQIAIAPHCTYQDPENFFSYRRTQEKHVQWSGIVSTSAS